MAGTIVVDRIESDASYASTINVASQVTFSNTVNFGITSVIPVAGFYLPTTNNLAFTTASTERMRIDSAGNVGINGALLSGTPGGAAGKVFSLAATQYPQSIMTATSGTTGNKNVRFIYRDSGVFQLQTLDDTYGSEITAYEVQRSTTGITYQAWSTGTAGSSAERMRIDSSGNLQFNSGYGSVATAYGCRAWVNFNGTGTVAIRASGNVSSITDNAVADYSINFTTAMPDANYSGHVTSDGAGGVGNFEQRGGGAGDITTTAWRVNGSGDRAYMHIIIIR